MRNSLCVAGAVVVGPVVWVVRGLGIDRVDQLTGSEQGRRRWHVCHTTASKGMVVVVVVAVARWMERGLRGFFRGWRHRFLRSKFLATQRHVVCKLSIRKNFGHYVTRVSTQHRFCWQKCGDVAPTYSLCCCFHQCTCICFWTKMPQTVCFVVWLFLAIYLIAYTCISSFIKYGIWVMEDFWLAGQGRTVNKFTAEHFQNETSSTKAIASHFDTYYVFSFDPIWPYFSPSLPRGLGERIRVFWKLIAPTSPSLTLLLRSYLHHS